MAFSTALSADASYQIHSSVTTVAADQTSTGGGAGPTSATIASQTVSAEGGVAVATVLILFSLVAVTENGAVLFTFYICRDLITPTNLFILSLTVCDFCIALFGNPFVVVSGLARGWYFGHFGCIFYGFFMTFLGLTSISLLTAISVDRYILIVHTMRAVTIDFRAAIFSVIGCLLYALFWSGVPLFGWNLYVQEASGLACSVQWQGSTTSDIAYIVLMLIFCLAIPLLLIGYSYIQIFIA
ncbi:melanopsin-like, partial [Octopus sinensis]|uniref:Melanopsin-like n=1 Tax=Octopus sinensis TaxID=2607531 RepID=A0A6P7TZI6_9MOLL